MLPSSSFDPESTPQGQKPDTGSSDPRSPLNPAWKEAASPGLADPGAAGGPGSREAGWSTDAHAAHSGRRVAPGLPSARKEVVSPRMPERLTAHVNKTLSHPLEHKPADPDDIFLKNTHSLRIFVCLRLPFTPLKAGLRSPREEGRRTLSPRIKIQLHGLFF